MPATWSSRAADEGTDTVQSSVSYTLGANVENLTLTGAATSTAPATGSPTRITGNGGDNILDGGCRRRHMIGGAGNDTYIVDNAGDVVTEALERGHRHGAALGQLRARRPMSRT